MESQQNYIIVRCQLCQNLLLRQTDHCIKLLIQNAFQSTLLLYDLCLKDEYIMQYDAMKRWFPGFRGYASLYCYSS